MFSLTHNRVYTEKPFFLPTYELFDRFYNDYLIKHSSVKELDYFEFGLCGRFMRDCTWDVDIRLMGSPKESDYEIISDFSNNESKSSSSLTTTSDRLQNSISRNIISPQGLVPCIFDEYLLAGA